MATIDRRPKIDSRAQTTRQQTQLSRLRLLAVVVAALGTAILGLPSVALAQASDGFQLVPGDPDFYCNGVKPTWVGTSGNDVFHGTPADDVIVAGDGDDIISGGGGHDLICGGDGNDVLSGQAGIDVIYGGSGNDKISGGRSIDMLYGEGGHDVLDGEHGPDLLRGQGGNDTLRGGDHNDDLHGGAGTGDRLLGGRGANHCNGGVNAANCDRPVSERYLSIAEWTVQDKESYAQVAWLRYELARDKVGGPYTGPVSNAMFHRLSGITCDQCIQLHHDHRSATFTARFSNLARLVINSKGQPRLKTPGKMSLGVGSTQMGRASEVWVLNAGSTAQQEFDQANQDMQTANEALGKANQEAGKALEDGDMQGLSNSLGDMEQAFKDGADAAARAKDAVDSTIDGEDDTDEDDTDGTGSGSPGGESGSGSGSGRTPGPGCGHHC